MRLENPADQTSLILACHDLLLVGVFWGVGFFGFFFKKQTQTQKIQFFNFKIEIQFFKKFSFLSNYKCCVYT